MSTDKPMEPMPLATPPAGVADATAPPLVGAEKWAANSIFDRKDERKMSRAMSGSLVAHGLLFAILLWGGFHAAKAIEQPPDKIDVVYLQQPGPGGGGGGSPTPAPPAKMEVPKPVTPPTPVPLEPVPVPPPPDPSLSAPITTLSNMMQANGQGAVNFAAFGGGGSGGGIGSGKGDGVGPGTGGGFGGGAYHQGNGCADPQLIHMVDPKYTSEAMRAKLQGDVELEVVVQKNGAVGEMRLTRSLDKQFGLDAAAMQAAKGWVFKPATCKGQAVDMIVGLVLEFRLH